MLQTYCVCKRVKLSLIMLLCCLQKCFPSKAHISVVYVLKPQGFFQKYSKPSFVAEGSIGDSKIQVRSKKVLHVEVRLMPYSLF